MGAFVSGQAYFPALGPDDQRRRVKVVILHAMMTTDDREPPALAQAEQLDTG